MIVSYNWLKNYIDLPMSVEELTERLTISGLNLEGLEKVGDDLAIDLEVTSNRPDCLGHIGVAREIAVLWDQSLKLSDPNPAQRGPPIHGVTSVTVESPELCRRYTARIIRGVKIGPSPAWLTTRLRSLGIAVINNVVDISNYVMMECGQPLHAFDFSKLEGRRIIVRKARAGERFLAIDHRKYELADGTCVISDTGRAVAVAGIMGGAKTEISEATTDLLLESADFDPLSVRTTARGLNLHSPSSFRFERGVDWPGIEWASRRAAELILELAGGELADGVIDVGQPPPERKAVKLRFHQIERILGITIPNDQVRHILLALGNRQTHLCEKCIKVIPPTWRADLNREIDLVEEVARIHGYDQIPEDAGVRLNASARSDRDKVLDLVHLTMTASGLHEAMTLSAVPRESIDLFRPWAGLYPDSGTEPLQTNTAILRRADSLRQTLVPSLLGVRRTNETLSNPVIELFEVAKCYLPRQGELPAEHTLLSMTSGGDFFQVKGILEALLRAISPPSKLRVEPWEDRLFVSGRGCRLYLEDTTENESPGPDSSGPGNQSPFGLLGEVSRWGLKQWDLRSETTVAELNLDRLVEMAELVRTSKPLSPYPSVDRDLNVVFDELVRWADVEYLTRIQGGDLLERITYQETYRDPDRLGNGKKSILFNILLRSMEGTLTSEKADLLRDQIVAALGKELGGHLRA